MTSDRSSIDYLNDMRDAASKAVEFLGSASLESLCSDDKSAFAIVRALEILGEAAKRIPQEIRDRYSELPWRSMTGIPRQIDSSLFSDRPRGRMEDGHGGFTRAHRTN